MFLNAFRFIVQMYSGFYLICIYFQRNPIFGSYRSGVFIKHELMNLFQFGNLNSSSYIKHNFLERWLPCHPPYIHIHMCSTENKSSICICCGRLALPSSCVDVYTTRHLNRVNIILIVNIRNIDLLRVFR